MWPIDQSALISSIAGAFAGAVGAAYISHRKEKTERIILEIRKTNVATAIVFDVCNNAISVKKQIVRPLYDSYMENKNNYSKFMMPNWRSISPKQRFYLDMDLRYIDKIHDVQRQPLQTLVSEHALVGSRALAALSNLLRSIDLFNDQVVKYNDIITEFRNSGSKDGSFIRVYIGIPDKDGNIDDRYGSIVNALRMYLDDIVFYSYISSIDIQYHNKILSKIVGSSSPDIARGDFSQAFSQDLIPQSEEYLKWLQSFQVEKEGYLEYVGNIIRDFKRILL